MAPVHDIVACPLRPAEVAQARLFDGILRAEIIQLEEFARFIANRRVGTADARIGAGQQPAELAQLRDRIAEAHCLLEALWRRFLHAHGFDDPRKGRNRPSF